MTAFAMGWAPWLTMVNHSQLWYLAIVDELVVVWKIWAWKLALEIDVPKNLTMKVHREDAPPGCSASSTCPCQSSTCVAATAHWSPGLLARNAFHMDMWVWLRFIWYGPGTMDHIYSHITVLNADGSRRHIPDFWLPWIIHYTCFHSAICLLQWLLHASKLFKSCTWHSSPWWAIA